MEVPERAFSSAPKEVPERGEALLGSRTFGRHHDLGRERVAPWCVVRKFTSLTRMRSTDIAVGSGRTITLRQRDFHGSSRGATDATGTTLWPTALPLLLHLQLLWPQVQQSVGAQRPVRVLELGAGCGLLGLGLAATCGADVLLTESGAALGESPEDGTALSWLEQNVELNRGTCESQGGRVAAAKLAWGDADDIAAVHAQVADGFDLVVASDVLYDSGRYPELWQTLESFAGGGAEASGGGGGAGDPMGPANAAAIIGYQIRNGQERRFGDDSESFEVVRAELPEAKPNQGRTQPDE